MRRNDYADPDVELGLALLDQRIMAGVGNLYKTEMCFLLGVPPWVPVRRDNRGATLKNLATGFCLDSNANKQVYTLGCNGGSYQRWGGI